MDDAHSFAHEPVHIRGVNERTLHDVKLLFREGFNTERMWVEVEKIEPEHWQGTLANEPVGLSLRMGQDLVFHPLDVIDIRKKNK